MHVEEVVIDDLVLGLLSGLGQWVLKVGDHHGKNDRAEDEGNGVVVVGVTHDLIHFLLEVALLFNLFLLFGLLICGELAS